MKKLFLLALLLRCGCAWGADAQDWAKIYDATKQAYVNQITVEKLAVAALKGINKVDKMLTLGNDNRRLSLYYKGKVVKVVSKPKEDNDVVEWGKITADVVATAEQVSAIVAKRNFAVDDMLAEGMLVVLDKDSKIFESRDDIEGRGPRNKRMFAARREDDKLHIFIGAFNKNTVEDLRLALNENADAETLEIDLSQCPGGMPGEAIHAADLFLDDGIIASVRGRDIAEEIFYTADEEGLAQGKDMTILIGEETASAAEIFTAALKEQGRAKVVGERSKGKGSTQKLIDLPSGSVLAITNGFFKTPSGGEINGKGVKPN